MLSLLTQYTFLVLTFRVYEFSLIFSTSSGAPPLLETYFCGTFELTIGRTAAQVVLTPKVPRMPAFEHLMAFEDLLTPCFSKEAGVLADNLTPLQPLALGEPPRELLGSLKDAAPFAERGGSMTSSLASFRGKRHPSVASFRTNRPSSHQEPLSKILEVLPCFYPDSCLTCRRLSNMPGSR